MKIHGNTWNIIVLVSLIMGNLSTNHENTSGTLDTQLNTFFCSILVVKMSYIKYYGEHIGKPPVESLVAIIPSSENYSQTNWAKNNKQTILWTSFFHSDASLHRGFPIDG